MIKIVLCYAPNHKYSLKDSLKKQKYNLRNFNLLNLLQMFTNDEKKSRKIINKRTITAFRITETIPEIFNESRDKTPERRI